MPPISIMVKPASGLCNMRCTYCFYADEAAHRQTASFGIMDEATQEALIRRAFTYAENSLSLAFQGGEPTLAGKEYFRRLLALEKKYNTRHIRVNHAIQTNGYALDDEWARLFAEGNFLVGVSLDGTQALHDVCRVDTAGKPTYSRIQQNLKLLDKYHVDYNILCVVNSHIAAHGSEVFHALKQYRYLQFIPCLDGLDGEKNSFSLDSKAYGQFLIETYDLYEKTIYSGHPVSVRNLDNWLGILLGMPPENCAMSGQCSKNFLVEADGSVYPCDFYVLDQWKLGNVREHSFFRLEKSPAERQFLQESLVLPTACASCKWFALCRGGCKRDREPLVPGKSVQNHLCEGHRIFFKSRAEQMKKLAEYINQKQF